MVFVLAIRIVWDILVVIILLVHPAAAGVHLVLAAAAVVIRMARNVMVIPIAHTITALNTGFLVVSFNQSIVLNDLGFL